MIYQMTKEIWKEIVRTSRCTYYVSNRGNVKSSRGLLKILLRPNGYPYVHIGTRKYLVSRLVAKAFIANPDNKPFIDHIDTDPTNNTVENLRWCTQSENLLNHNTALKRCILLGDQIAHEVAAKNGICHRTFITRIFKGWSVEEACTKPVKKRRHYKIS